MKESPKAISIDHKVGKVCPLFSIMKKEPYMCIKGACAWYNKVTNVRGITNECICISLNRNILDTWLTIKSIHNDMR